MDDHAEGDVNENGHADGNGEQGEPGVPDTATVLEERELPLVDFALIARLRHAGLPEELIEAALPYALRRERAELSLFDRLFHRGVLRQP